LITTITTGNVGETRNHIAAARLSGRPIGFIPTMGALHDGHRGLIENARAECGFVAVSIFVNPLQFAPSEDYSRYPRDLAADAELCRAAGADLIFAPSAAEMYPEEQLTFVEVDRIGDNLCGRFRPGHFRGVATVVLKLFNIVQPDRAYFGEKDLQQLAVIRRMVRDMALPLTVVPVATVREPDGLALSSRNRYLSADERRAAPVVYRALRTAFNTAGAGERDAQRILAAGLAVLDGEPLARVQYFEVVDSDMQPVSQLPEPAYAAASVFLGSTRLIDNIKL
jgi:pantoate--beta-alanine ligase